MHIGEGLNQHNHKVVSQRWHQNRDNIPAGVQGAFLRADVVFVTGGQVLQDGPGLLLVGHADGSLVGFELDDAHSLVRPS